MGPRTENSWWTSAPEKIKNTQGGFFWASPHTFGKVPSGKNFFSTRKWFPEKYFSRTFCGLKISGQERHAQGITREIHFLLNIENFGILFRENHFWVRGYWGWGLPKSTGEKKIERERESRAFIYRFFLVCKLAWRLVFAFAISLRLHKIQNPQAWNQKTKTSQNPPFPVGPRK